MWRMSSIRPSAFTNSVERTCNACTPASGPPSGASPVAGRTKYAAVGVQANPIKLSLMLQNRIRGFLSIQALLALVCCAVELYCRLVLHLIQPYNIPIVHNMDDQFPDFSLWLSARFNQFHSPAFFHAGPYPYMYPAGAALVYEAFHPFSNPVLAFGIAIGLVLVAAAILFARALILRGVKERFAYGSTAAGLLLSYPIWFAIQRGNLELFVWPILALGVWAFYRGEDYLAAACFGIAAAIKIYPAAYLGLFIARGRYKQLGAGLLVAGLVSLFSLWAICPDLHLAWRGINQGLTQFQLSYVQHTQQNVLGFDHSLFALLRWTFNLTDAQLTHNSGRYMPGIIAIGIGVFFARIVKLPFANQLLALTIAMICFPPVSFDYTLLHLYTPLCLLLVSTTQARPVLLALLAVAVSPLTEFISHGQTFGSEIRAVVLLCLFVLALLWPMAADETRRPTSI